MYLLVRYASKYMTGDRMGFVLGCHWGGTGMGYKVLVAPMGAGPDAWMAWIARYRRV